MANTAGRDAALADAYAALMRDGEVPTVRRMKERAGVSTDAAAAWLRTNRPAAEAPAVPDDFARTLWPLAFTAARDVAVEAVTQELEAARQAEAEALTRADEADAAQRGAMLRADRAMEISQEAQAEATAARERTEQAEAQVRELEAERDRLVERLRDMEARAVRAEAVADTMREVVDGLRGEVRAALDGPKS